jgi:hypothetical protein
VASINEPVGTGESVIAVVREETMEKGIPPVDMQCAAQGGTKGSRHKEDIYWDEDNRVWSSLCEKHTLQNDDARNNEAKKVVLYTG